MSRSRGRRLVDTPAADAQLAAGDVLEPGDHAQRGGLAAAGRADQHEERSVVDREVQVGDGPDSRSRRSCRVGRGRCQPSEDPPECVDGGSEGHGAPDQPFTAPAVRPETMKRWARKKTIKAGIAPIEGSGGERSPAGLEALVDEARETDGQRVAAFAAAQQVLGEDQLVHRRQERDEEHDDEDGHRQGEDHLAVDLEVGRPVDLRRLVEVLGDGVEEPLHAARR